ncbi:putative uncharacterized membrane protein [Clavispora lusitaniae]|uniref:Uncharacterized membrane protein n=1 Tax=Clavispora lusitaniae TaxID=36911 RepID=A0ACD0WEZ1_CLALS|nr:Major Facilitator Superfamily protein [Clavispora lusitaniae]QFZ26052.1 putative uncharacterized membrane protein [Clavispora lusitaniae]QFZ30645.1 putative uncharacterized membrane protein [Clavispora lusitaniae]QFZ36313.1 putative uncharacterized membrane protein [Clavispora lusitaniae]QFZ41997.1 putative uncharacterized membrane protein [Clavispora lusitaniae]
MAALTFREQMAGMPIRQMVVVSLIRFSEPLAFTSLFPYMYFMIRDFHVAPTEQDISKYSGYLASSFAFFQFLFAVQWGKMSNRVGRKPVLLCGLFGTCISLVTFGFSTNYYMALAARSLAGALNGNIAVLRTVIGEICVERRHQALGFSTLPLLFNFGSIIGPLIGGSALFTRPNPHSPYEDEHGNTSSLSLSTFGNSWYDAFVERHPYVMSNIVVSVFLCFSMVIGFFFLEETNENFRQRRDYGVELGDAFLARFGVEPPTRPWQKKSDEERPLLHHTEHVSASQVNDFRATAATEEEAPSGANEIATEEAVIDESDDLDPIPLVSKPMTNAMVRRYSSSSSVFGRTDKDKTALTGRVISVIISNCIISLHSIAYNEFLPVLLASRFQRDLLKFPFRIGGGFGLDSSYIGTLFSSTGVMGIIIVLVIFPWIDRTLGTIKGFRLSLSFFPLVYASVPMAIFTLHKYNNAFPSWFTPIFLYSLTTLKTLASATGMPQVMLLNHRAAAKEHRAYVNSLTMSMLALARCLGPIIFGYLMTFGDRHNMAWLVWWLMALMALCGFLHSFTLDDYED